MNCRKCNLPVARMGNTTRVALTCECVESGKRYEPVICDYCGDERIIEALDRRDMRERITRYVNNHAECRDLYAFPRMSNRTRLIGR